MKKVFAIAGVMGMLMGMAAGAHASVSQWTVYLNAGVLNGTAWSASQGGTMPASFGVDAAAASGYFASLTPTTAGIYGVNPDASKMANKDLRAYNAAATSYTWDLKLATGASWTTTNTCTVGIKLSSTKTFAPGWTLELFRNGASVKKFDSTSATNTWLVVSQMSQPVSALEDWKMVASVTPTTITPEPGSMVAMFSGLVGLVGFGIRRRK